MTLSDSLKNIFFFLPLRARKRVTCQKSDESPRSVPVLSDRLAFYGKFAAEAELLSGFLASSRFMAAIRFYCLLPRAPTADIRSVPFHIPILSFLSLSLPLSQPPPHYPVSLSNFPFSLVSFSNFFLLFLEAMKLTISEKTFHFLQLSRN